MKRDLSEEQLETIAKYTVFYICRKRKTLKAGKQANPIGIGLADIRALTRSLARSVHPMNIAEMKIKTFPQKLN